MKVKARLRTLAARALAESMDVKRMTHVARRMLGNYDLHARTGFPPSVPIPNKTAARQIVDDVADADLFLEFVGFLVSLERVGMAGRKYRIPRLNAIITEITDTGYRYDEKGGTFLEDRTIRTTRNWGVLREGESYVMAFLGIDVAGNSRLVRVYGREQMHRIYSALRSMTTESVERRNGRLWSWEGDGGLYAFTFEEQNQRAVVAAMEVLHEVFLYNLAACTIQEGVHVRLTVHTGPCTYQSDGSELKSETVKHLWAIDSRHGQVDTLTVSAAIPATLAPPLAQQFTPLPTEGDDGLHAYAVRLE
jgi:hypothetical protein